VIQRVRPHARGAARRSSAAAPKGVAPPTGISRLIQGSLGHGKLIDIADHPVHG